MNWKFLLLNSTVLFVVWELIDLLFYKDPFINIFYNLCFAPLMATILLKMTTGTWTGKRR